MSAREEFRRWCRLGHSHVGNRRLTGRLLTARELAEQLGVSTSALLRWTRAGRVPAVKLPSGAVRYVPEQVEAWLADHSTRALLTDTRAESRMQASPTVLHGQKEE